MSASLNDHKDFFISYTAADEKWAEWIAWQLEQAGFSVIIQAWDFRPGSNFVIEMDAASLVAERTVVVLSPAFFESHFTPAEWASAFANDPSGAKRSIVPVRVERCDVAGLLGQVVYIDLVDVHREDAAKKLISGIQPGRSKPTTEPGFPGTKRVAAAPGSPSRTTNALDWQKEADRPVTWRSELSRNNRESAGHSIVELQLIPTDDLPLQVRRLRELPDELAHAGRVGGLFSASQQLTTDSSSDFAYVKSMGEFASEDAGLLVTRSGQRGAWISLPRDMMGSVLDEADLTARVASVLTILVSLDLPLAPRYALAASLGPTLMLTVGSATIIGNRNSASMMSAPEDKIVLAVEDSVNSNAISTSANELAEELVARLIARTKRRN